MPTLQELIASGYLTNPTGLANADSGRNSLAALANTGKSFYGRAGLDLPGYLSRSSGALPQLYRVSKRQVGDISNNEFENIYDKISYQDAIASNFRDVGYGDLSNGGTIGDIEQQSNRYYGRQSANLGDVFEAAGFTTDPAREQLMQQINSGVENPELFSYTDEAAYNSLLNDQSGYNAADSREHTANAIKAFLAVLTAGMAYNAYGAGAMAGEGAAGGAPVVEGGMTTAEIDAGIAANGGAPVASGGYAYGSSALPATTYGIGETAPAVGTPLPAAGSTAGGTGSTVGMSASEELAAAGYTPEQIAAFQETGFLPTVAGTSGGIGGAINTVGNVSSAGSAISRILDGTASNSDWLSVLGTAGATGLGVYSDIQRTNSLNDLADKYASYGAPYRQRLSDLYANPSSFLSSPEVQVPVQQGTDAMARSLSAKVGNPVFSGTALQELQNYSSNQLFSKLGQEKDRLAGFGGLTAYNNAAPGAATNAINSSGNYLTTLAGGVSDIFNPRQSLTDLLKQYRGDNLFGVA